MGCGLGCLRSTSSTARTPYRQACLCCRRSVRGRLLAQQGGMIAMFERTQARLAQMLLNCKR
jgi:hypothetical protein